MVAESFRRPGGIQTYNRDQIQAIRRCEPDQPLSLLVLNDSEDEVRQEEWRELHAEGFARHKLAFARRSLAAARRQRPRRIILGHRNFLPLAPALRASAPASSLWLLTYGVDARPRLSPLERMFLRAVARVFAISPQTAETLRLAGRRGPIELWPCSLPFSWEMPQFAPPRFKPPFRLLTVSRLAVPERSKGIDHTIAAVGLLVAGGVPVRLDVVGEGQDLARLQQVARASGAEPFATFHGQLPIFQLRELYSGCDLFVLPSGGEGFGIVYLEALAYGKPVIAADAGGAPFVVRPGVSGFLVPYGDPKALADSISERIRRPDEARAIGDKGRRFLEETFSFSAMVRTTGRLIAAGRGAR